MKILIMVWSIQIGGAESFAINLARYFKKRGLSPFLFPVSDVLDHNYLRDLEEEGIKIISPFTNGAVNLIAWKVNSVLNLLGVKNFRQELVRRRFETFLRKECVRIIISNAYTADRFLARYHRNTSIPYIVIEHGEYSYSIIDKKEIELEGILGASRIVCVSEWCKTILAKKIDVPISVILNGHKSLVESKQERLPELRSEGNFVFGMIGRSVEYKGWEDAIRAFILVQRQHHNVRLLLIGDGPVHDRLKRQYAHCTEIFFVGKVNRPDELLRSIDVGLVPSRRYEAFGIVLLDFFSCDIPVIATDVGGIREVLGFGENSGGLLIQTNSLGSAEPTVLAEAMSKFLTDRKFYQMKSQAAREIYRRFSFDNVGIEYEKLVESLVDGSINNNSQL